MKLGDLTGAARFGLALTGGKRHAKALPEALPHLFAAVEADPTDREKLLHSLRSR